MALETVPTATKLGAGFHKQMHTRLTEVRYAHPNGDNAKDGLTWGTAKQDIGSAYDALPSTGGTIYFANETYVSASDSEQGLWITAQSSPPAGWRTQKRLRLVGVGGSHTPQGHTSQAVMNGHSSTNRNKPTLWISETAVPLEFENIQIRYPAVAVKIGIDIAGTGYINTSGITFRRCGFEVNQVVPNGPTIELGYVFWLFMYDCVISGNLGAYTPSAASITAGTTARFTIGTHFLKVGDTVHVLGMTPAGYNGLWTVSAVAATTFDANIGTSPAAASVMGTVTPVRHYRRNAIGHDGGDVFPGGAPCGLVHIENSNFSGGGFHYYTGGMTSAGSLILRNITMEGADLTHHHPPVLHVRANLAAASAIPTTVTGIFLQNIELADVLEGAVAVSVDGVHSAANSVTAINAAAEGNVTVLGKPGVINHRRVELGDGVIRGHTPATPRVLGAAPALFVNHAVQDVSTWSGLGGGATVTTGKPAPDGSSLAARLSAASNQEKQVAGPTLTIAVGDWFVSGAWRRFHSGSTAAYNYPFFQITTGSYITDNDGQSYDVLDKPDILDDGTWQWAYKVTQVVSGTGPTGTVKLDLRVAAGCAIDYFAPVLAHIPTSADRTTGEILELARNLRSWPDGAPVGSVSTLVNQKLIARGGLGVGNSAAATTPGSVVKKMEVFSETGASLGFVPIYSSIA